MYATRSQHLNHLHASNANFVDPLFGHSAEGRTHFLAGPLAMQAHAYHPKIDAKAHHLGRR